MNNYCETCEKQVMICDMCDRRLNKGTEIICFKQRYHFCGHECLEDYGSFHNENIVIYNECSVVEKGE